jgi:hypothetical protein
MTVKKDLSNIKDLLKYLPTDEAKVELKLQVKTELKNFLNPTQVAALEHIGWFLYGGRGTGRSYVAATAAIFVAIDNPNTWVQIWDHVELRGYMMPYMLDIIRGIIHKSEILEIKDFVFTSTHIKYVEK